MKSLGSFIGSVRSRLIPSLSYRDYRVMWIGHVAGESSSWALGAAEGWLVFNLAESSPSSWVGAVMLAAMLPWFVVPVIVGYLTDRFSRRNILAVAYAVSLLHGLALAMLVFTGAIQVWHVLLLAFVNGVARAIHMGAIEALTANLVPWKDLANSYTLVAAGYYATRLIGPGLIAPIIGAVDLKWIFLGCTGVYGIGLFLVLQISTVSTGVVTRGKGVVYNVFSGFRFVYGNWILRSVMFLVMFHCTLVMSFESLLPAISDNRLDAGGGGVAYMHMMIGLGALVVSIVLAPIRDHRLRGKLFLCTAVVSTFGNVILGVSPHITTALLGTVIIGISHTGFMTIATIIIQSESPDALRGRVTSIYLIHAGGIMSFSYFVNGALADVFNPGWILVFGSAIFLTAVAGSLIVPACRRLYQIRFFAPAERISDTRS